MKVSRISERLIAAMLVLFLLSYVTYQVYRYYRTPLQVEAVLPYTISHAVDASGVVLRDEVIIGHEGGGVESFVAEDGERVAIGQTVAEFYLSEVSDLQVRRMREIRREIVMLTEAQNPAVSNYSNVEGLGRDIRGELGTVVQMAGVDRYDNLSGLRESVTSLLNKRLVAVGKESGYEQRIQELEAEYERLDASSEDVSLDTASAPVSGYFVRAVDGLEQSFSTDHVGTLSVGGYRTLAQSAPSPAPGAAGKIVTSERWYYVALVPKYDIQWVRKGQTVNLHFDTVDDQIPGVVTEILQENQEEEAVLVIRCNHVSGDLLSLRFPDASISFEEYSGLRINTASIRAPGDVRGVYVLSKNTVRFKKIDPIYEESGFIISKPSDDPRDTEMVKLFDQVITKGKDLYDGKVVE